MMNKLYLPLFASEEALVDPSRHIAKIDFNMNPELDKGILLFWCNIVSALLRRAAAVTSSFANDWGISVPINILYALSALIVPINCFLPNHKLLAADVHHVTVINQ